MPSASRRSVLALVGSTAAVGLAGCVGSPTAETDASGNDPSTGATTTSPANNGDQTSGPASTDAPAGPVQCAGEPVSVERTLADEPGYVDDMEYFPGNGTVRIVATRSGDGPSSFRDWDFEGWAGFQCADVALDRVREVTADRLGTDEFGSGVGRPPQSAPTDGVVVTLHLSKRVDDDGNVVETPAVSVGQLVERAPASVDATVSLEGDTFSRVVPVYAETSVAGFGGD